ncbi:MAG: hypothetical protein ABF289_20125 [Clostridiales bacterium]
MKIDDLKYVIETEDKSDFVIRINDDKNKFLCDPELYSDSIIIKVYGGNSLKEKYKKIGVIMGRYFRLSKLKYDLFEDIFDCVDQENHELYTDLYDENTEINDKYVGLKRNIFHIEKFYIEEEYRNMGLGSKILIHLDDVLSLNINCEVGAYILKPNTIKKDKNDDLTSIEDKVLYKRLVDFYKRFGFKKIESSDYMFINTDYISKMTS